MAYTKRNCDNCSTEYKADNRNLKRGWSLCCSKSLRRNDLESIIISKGGIIGSSVSKNTTHLVMKSKGSGSTKETKAISLGVEILTVEELEDLLK